MTELFAHQPLVRVTRSGHTESIHYGSIVVLDNQEKLIASVGDPDCRVFIRSCAKPFQALPLFAHPQLAELKLSDAEMAITCGSHSGEPRHLLAVRGLLEKAGCQRSELKCGTHVPMYFDALGRNPNYEDIYTPLHHNCSGKHAGMLAWCKLNDVSAGDYLQPGHPLQGEILQAVARFSGLEAHQIDTGVDGCGAPNFRLPLKSLANAYMRLVSEDQDPHYADAHQRIYRVMTEHPEMISGLRRIDLLLTHVGARQWLSKVGAEAVHALGIRSNSWGIAIKIADGGQRARAVVTIEVLRQLGLIGDLAQTPLEEFARPEILDDRGQVVGDIQTLFKLQSAA